MASEVSAAPWVPDGASVTALRRAAPECRGCELWEDAERVVFSSGPARARLVLVGEQPGDQEDRRGEPFVGPAGRVLDQALEAAGIDRAAAYLTNAVKHLRHEKRGKRRIHQKPELRHLIACGPWLEAELAVVRPAVVVALGATAGRAVLGRPVKVGAERGAVLDGPVRADGGDAWSVVLTTHPSALLRLRGRGGWDEAFDGLVADLAVARAAAAG